MPILVIDQGTTNTKALVFDDDGHILRKASAGCKTDYPQSGWAEQSAEEIWATTQSVIREVTSNLGEDFSAIGISNQRETLVVWDAETGRPVGPAPIWQCRRTTTECATLIAAGHCREVVELTGLAINPLFPASKLAWILSNRPEAGKLHQKERLRAGTVDAWLLWNMTDGASFATDHSNASRTMLFDTSKLAWSARLAEIFGAPIDCLPEPMASDSLFGVTAEGATSLPAGIPIHAIMGDSHAALFGHGIRLPGRVKATYGTGSSLMTLCTDRAASHHGLSGTIAWTHKGTTAYALEGNITVSAQAAEFAARMLGLADAPALSALAQEVPNNGGVQFVPALAGLGAPHWDDNARGLISGLSHGTLPAHLARATFEAIAHQIADVFEAMVKDIGRPLDALCVDGGASGNAWLMQLQSDFLGCPVERRGFPDIGALGVAFMASEALGQAICGLDSDTTIFTSGINEQARMTLRNGWREALGRARSDA